MILGFVSPNGTEYPCQYMEHTRLAKRLCQKFGFIKEIEKIAPRWNGVDCENYLIAQGFLALYSRSAAHGCQFCVSIGGMRFAPVKMTPEQEVYIQTNLAEAFNTDQFDKLEQLLEWNKDVDVRIAYFEERRREKEQARQLEFA